MVLASRKVSNNCIKPPCQARWFNVLDTMIVVLHASRIIDRDFVIEFENLVANLFLVFVSSRSEDDISIRTVVACLWPVTMEHKVENHILKNLDIGNIAKERNSYHLESNMPGTEFYLLVTVAVFDRPLLHWLSRHSKCLSAMLSSKGITTVGKNEISVIQS